MKRYKKILPIIIGVIIGISTIVGAATIFNSKDITYSSSLTTKKNVKDSLDELYTNLGKCPKGKYCYTEPTAISDKVELGDYISMTPLKENYVIKASKSGYSIDQNINPSELSVWRVINKNADGTIEVISEYVSSEKIYLSGKIGYINYIGILNEIALSYINEEYVIEARPVGYKDQTEEINSNIDYPVWEEETRDNSNEAVVGGDILYKSDYKLIEESIKTMRAKNIKKEKASYYLASRYYKYNKGNYSFNGRIVDEEENI